MKEFLLGLVSYLVVMAVLVGIMFVLHWIYGLFVNPYDDSGLWFTIVVALIAYFVGYSRGETKKNDKMST